MSATVLYICAGITWGGCGVVQYIDYGSEVACRTALAQMVIAHNGSKATGDGGRQVIALCRPPESKKN